MLILLPPSEGKAGPRRGRPLDLGALTSPGLTPTRERVLDALVALCRDDPAGAARILGLGPSQQALVVRNTGLREAPTARADAVYTGVLYDALGFATLSPSARRRATARVATTSALLGLVRPGDRIPAYRLSGDTTLPRLGSVAGAWRTCLGDAVAEAAHGGLVVDLRSSTYAAFWRPGREESRRVATVRVLHESAGRRTVVSHFNKATKGRIVRALLEEGAAPRTPRALADVLGDLGWTVETSEPGATGTRLDVVVTEV